MHDWMIGRSSLAGGDNEYAIEIPVRPIPSTVDRFDFDMSGRTSILYFEHQH